MSSRLYIITEFMERGSLRELLLMNHQLSWRLILRMIKDIAEGLLFLHQSSIVHRDLKTANILCDRDFNLKLADFGLAKYTHDDVHRTMSGTGMNPRIIPNEIYL